MTRRERDADLDELRKRLARHEQEARPKPSPPAPAKRAAPAAPSPEPPAAPVSFDDEMRRMGVAPEPTAGAERVVVAPRPEGPLRPPPSAKDDESAWEDATRGVVTKGGAPGRSASLPTLDLHGFSETDALAELRRFLALHRGPKAAWVRVITGRGRDGGGVLRAAVARWLKQSSAVASLGHAPPAEGGEGVLLVQLRRRSSG